MGGNVATISNRTLGSETVSFRREVGYYVDTGTEPETNDLQNFGSRFDQYSSSNYNYLQYD